MSKRPFTIVVGLDYSDHSDVALDRGFELASGEMATELHVVALHPAVDLARARVPKSALLEVEVAAARLQRYVARRWADFSRERQHQWVQPPARVVSHARFDEAGRGIVQLASDLSADLIIVGTHGREGFTRFLLGSVSERVLRLSACPVLVVRPKTIIGGDSVIQPPCQHCRQVRELSSGELWCEEHRDSNGRSHTHHPHDG
jgi:nucleotide-binding universal stress UspA family protein